MQLSYYFIRQISQYLAESLIDWQLAEAFSQERDELVLVWTYRQQAFLLRAHLSPQASYLSFPEAYHRARSNVVDLFPDFTGRRLVGVINYDNERAFALHFDQDYLLLFKLFGNRANVIGFHADVAIDLFHKRMQTDSQLVPEQLHRPIERTFWAFQAAKHNYKLLFPTFDSCLQAYIQQQGWHQLPAQSQWQYIYHLHEQLLSPTHYYIGLWQGKPWLTFFAPEGFQVQYCTQSPIEAANAYHKLYLNKVLFEQQRRSYQKQIERKIERCQKAILQAEERITQLQQSRYEELGHLIMAYLHQIPNDAQEVNLFDFYQNQPIRIKLKAGHSPQQNAEYYYRKAKNQKIELQQLQHYLERQQAECKKLNQQLETLNHCTHFRQLRQWAKHEGYETADTHAQQSLPFRQFEYDGFSILVGKNAQSNDLLTQRYAHKDDLWLHAKDVSGSHVVVKRKGSKHIPRHVVEKAASLAAYYSKRRNDSLCPVIVTEKKYVRKSKGMPPGQVAIEREQVLLVRPIPFDEEDLA